MSQSGIAAVVSTAVANKNQEIIDARQRLIKKLKIPSTGNILFRPNGAPGRVESAIPLKHIQLDADFTDINSDDLVVTKTDFCLRVSGELEQVLNFFETLS